MGRRDGGVTHHIASTAFVTAMVESMTKRVLAGEVGISDELVAQGIGCAHLGQWRSIDFFGERISFARIRVFGAEVDAVYQPGAATYRVIPSGVGQEEA